MKIILVVLAVICVASIIGCETVHQGAKEVGKPIGKATTAIGGITEGATEGYVGETSSEENPYGR